MQAEPRRRTRPYTLAGKLSSFCAPSNGPEAPAAAGGRHGAGPSAAGRRRRTRPVVGRPRTSLVSSARLARRCKLHHLERHQPARDVPARHIRSPAHRQRAGPCAVSRVQHRASLPPRPAVGPRRARFPNPARAVRRHRGAIPHQTALCPVRLLLGPAPQTGSAAGAKGWGAQLRVGAKSGC